MDNFHPLEPWFLNDFLRFGDQIIQYFARKKKQKLENEKQISQRLRIQPKKMIIIVSNLFLNCIYINVLYICLSWVVKAMYV